MTKFKEYKGITLIALVITIIVLIILAGVTIAMITGQDSAPNKAAEAKLENDKGSMKDAANLLATKYIQDYYEKKYVQSLSDFAYANQGEYAETEFPTETEGGYTYSVSGHILTVIDAKGNSVKGKINSDGTIVWYGKMLPTNIKIGDEIIDLSTLNATSVAQYYGTTVKTAYNTEYGLFYVDYAGKYGEPGTIYLRAKTNKGSTSVSSNLSDADKSIALSIMKEINPQWNAARGSVEYSDFTKAEKGAAYLCNPNYYWWSGIKNAFDASYLNYVIGGPSLEMFLDSYNARYPDLTPEATVEYLGAGERYTYPGYTVSEGLTIPNENIQGGMYLDTSKSEWLASPMSHGIDDCVYLVSNMGYLAAQQYNYVVGFAPLVSLKAGVDLTN